MALRQNGKFIVRVHHLEVGFDIWGGGGRFLLRVALVGLVVVEQKIGSVDRAKSKTRGSGLHGILVVERIVWERIPVDIEISIPVQTLRNPPRRHPLSGGDGMPT